MLRPRSGIIGADNRVVRRDNTSYPWSTVTYLPRDGGGYSGSGTMIGASTALTAAHVVHNGINWLELPWFAPGTDFQDATRFPFGQFGCYTVSIPSAFNGLKAANQTARMKAKSAKQPKKEKSTIEVKDLKPSKDPKGATARRLFGITLGDKLALAEIHPGARAGLKSPPRRTWEAEFLVSFHRHNGAEIAKCDDD